MTEKNITLLSSVYCLALGSVGGYRIFTNNIEPMSILVAYIFFITGSIGFVFSVVKLSRIKQT
ncbi:hypothetical protein ACZ11_07000 [Lysinibacillus xylanilyticus]|uniref:Uncharacterized protein n=1 Tax=Lysinibacillus xylanilyticus TaxID=582475 RepID=A0A0K9FCH3_9BACI|nr:hypothetical protein ACZ11_07000 [Lysinibacillus xylanilyticus]